MNVLPEKRVTRSKREATKTTEVAMKPKKRRANPKAKNTAVAVDTLKEANTENTSGSEKSADEYEVSKFLNRRLMNDAVKGKIPLEKDYEYLVSWEGYADEDNSWEPYENVKHCTERLKEFHERISAKSKRGRRGKRQ